MTSQLSEFWVQSQHFDFLVVKGRNISSLRSQFWLFNVKILIFQLISNKIGQNCQHFGYLRSKF